MAKLTIAEIVSNNKIDKRKVYNAINAGKLTGEKIKNDKNTDVWLFEEEVVSKWIASIKKPKSFTKKASGVKNTSSTSRTSTVKKSSPKKSVKISTTKAAVKSEEVKVAKKPAPVKTVIHKNNGVKESSDTQLGKSAIGLFLSIILAAVGVIGSILLRKNRKK